MPKDFEFKGTPIRIELDQLDASSDYTIQTDKEGLELIIAFVNAVADKLNADRIALPLYDW